MLDFFQFRRVLAWHLFLLLLAASLCFVPLFDVLGYEFSLALALPVSFAAAHLSSLFTSMVRRKAIDHGETPRLVALAGQTTLIALTLLLTPLLLISLNALRVRNCNFIQGLVMFVLIPLCSGVLSAFVGTTWALVLRLVASIIASFTTVALCLLWSGYRFYSEPPVSL